MISPTPTGATSTTTFPRSSTERLQLKRHVVPRRASQTAGATESSYRVRCLVGLGIRWGFCFWLSGRRSGSVFGVEILLKSRSRPSKLSRYLGPQPMAASMTRMVPKATKSKQCDKFLRFMRVSSLSCRVPSLRHHSWGEWRPKKERFKVCKKCGQETYSAMPTYPGSFLNTGSPQSGLHEVNKSCRPTTIVTTSFTIKYDDCAFPSIFRAGANAVSEWNTACSSKSAHGNRTLNEEAKPCQIIQKFVSIAFCRVN
jgi:hypothetical protein